MNIRLARTGLSQIVTSPTSLWPSPPALARKYSWVKVARRARKTNMAGTPSLYSASAQKTSDKRSTNESVKAPNLLVILE